MTIAEAREKCKATLGQIPRDMLSIGVLILASGASFWLGFLAGRDAGQGSEASAVGQSPTQEVGAPTKGVGVVASKNGTKYYPLDCAGASRIADANKVWFASVSAAEEAGYAPAVNCNGR